jgi:hypothetical protein
VKNKYKRKTLQQVGKELEKKVLGPFVNVFFILAVEVSYGVISYGMAEGVGVGRAAAKEIIGQMINEVVDRCYV